MTAWVLIAGYATLWIAWSSLVGAVRDGIDRGPRPWGAARCVWLMVQAMAPIVAFAWFAHGTAWIPERVNVMLTLMTPVLTAAFVAAAGPLRRSRPVRHPSPASPPRSRGGRSYG
jgi:hypothetical protein